MFVDKHAKLILLQFISFCFFFVGYLKAEERLISRFTYFPDNVKCQFWPGFAWGEKYVAANRAVLKYAVDEDYFYKYTPDFNGLSGDAEVFIYKYGCGKNFDNHVLVEVFHAEKRDTFYVDFCSQRDEWVSIGKFSFEGKKNEYVKFYRKQESHNGKITPALPIRFDLYFDTNERALSEKEKQEKQALGLTTTGHWSLDINAGYYPAARPMKSFDKGATVTWNPASNVVKGVYNLYLYKPCVKNDDSYRIIHKGKAEEICLRNLQYANLSLCNPPMEQGWYKLGCFDFAGDGSEYVQLLKNGQDSTFVDCLMFEQIKLDGTILHRTLVTPLQNVAAKQKAIRSFSFEEKLERTKQVVGLSPNANQHTVVTSSKNGSTVYSRALWSTEKSPRFVWNPCIVEPGQYTLYYFPYYKPLGEKGQFIFHSAGKKQSVEVDINKLEVGKQCVVGKFEFAGKAADEYVEMLDINRASDVTFEKEVAGGTILKQVVVTAHPYFKDFLYDDTRHLAISHSVSEMVRRGFMQPRSVNLFGINKAISSEECAKILSVMLDSIGVNCPSSYLLHSMKRADTTATEVTLNVLAQLMLNAMEESQRYLNVSNLFRTDIEATLAAYPKRSEVIYPESFARMIEIGVIHERVVPALSPTKKLTRGEVALLLKEFNEQIFGSGPPAFVDWEVSFHDEFDGINVDWSKWTAEDWVRFKGVSAKWKENCVVEDGLFKGYNYMDNHEVPYGSGNIYSNYRQTYGFFEARYRYPNQAYGSHSSFWTSAKGGDFNYNEGAYPNSVSNNNYFMRTGTNFNDFTTPTNLAHDFHTIAGYLNEKDLFYSMDGKITYEVKDYPRFYSQGTGDYKAYSTTKFPYNVMMSTVVTYFDGPLDRDRIDGSFMACDWVRVYRETTFPCVVEQFYCLTQAMGATYPDREWVVKLNKPVQNEMIDASSFIISSLKGLSIPKYSIKKMNPVRYILLFDSPMGNSDDYQIIYDIARE